MFQGELIGIFIAPHKRDDLQAVAQVEAIPGRGLVGDRYFLQDGTFSKKDSPDREVTLIEIEALEALARESSITLQPGQAGRNLVTCGAPLNHLVDREFTAGEVVLHGIRLCEPCSHPESLTCKGVHNGLSPEKIGLGGQRGGGQNDIAGRFFQSDSGHPNEGRDNGRDSRVASNASRSAQLFEIVPVVL